MRKLLFKVLAFLLDFWKKYKAEQKRKADKEQRRKLLESDLENAQEDTADYLEQAKRASIAGRMADSERFTRWMQEAAREAADIRRRLSSGDY